MENCPFNEFGTRPVQIEERSNKEWPIKVLMSVLQLADQSTILGSDSVWCAPLKRPMDGNPWKEGPDILNAPGKRGHLPLERDGRCNFEGWA